MQLLLMSGAHKCMFHMLNMQNDYFFINCACSVLWLLWSDSILNSKINNNDANFSIMLTRRFGVFM